MSWREHWPNVKSSVVPGDVISGCRDNETCTYRLFVNKGWRYVGAGKGYQVESCECCDLSLDDLRALAVIVQKAIDEHKTWPEVAD